jgi:acyl-CoA dehydrogenase
MLNAALAAGRGISLPSLSSAAAALAVRTSSAYARVRRQFEISICEFEGVQERLARMAAIAYELDAARRLTCAGLALGHRPSVVSAIMKHGATERMRIAVNDAMDVHAGKAVMDGPRNYLANMHRATPIAITVEGANILTRSLILFGQGAIRAHPYLFKEMEALAERDAEVGLSRFDAIFWRHAGHLVATAGRTFARAWTDGATTPAPKAGAVRRYYQKLGRYASAFALAADLALVTMGGALKRKEMLSGRFGDILSELYFLSATLKRWEDEGRQDADLAIVEYVVEQGFLVIERRFKEIIDNFPNRLIAQVLGFFILPFGVVRRGPSDRLVQAICDAMTTPSGARERISEVFVGGREEPLAKLERAFELSATTEDIRRRLRKSGIAWRSAHQQGLLTEAERALLELTEEVSAAVIAVDDFAPEEMSPKEPRRARAPSKPELAAAK